MDTANKAIRRRLRKQKGNREALFTSLSTVYANYQKIQYQIEQLDKQKKEYKSLLEDFVETVGCPRWMVLEGHVHMTDLHDYWVDENKEKT